MRGYFVIDGMYPNAIAVGVPVFHRRGTPIATITTVAPKARANKVAAKRLGELSANNLGTARNIWMYLRPHR